MVAAAALLLAGAGTVVANEFRTEVAPNTPEGQRYVRELLQRFRDIGTNSRNPAEYAPVPRSARVVFSIRTRDGEYTLWRARTEGPGGRALVFSSPRAGVSGSIGPLRRLHGRFVSVDGGLSSGRSRELFGRVSTGVTGIRVELKNGRRARAIVANGWFVFSQDIGHSKPVRFVGLDRQGRVVVTSAIGLP
jgi:hypothetical protein